MRSPMERGARYCVRAVFDVAVLIRATFGSHLVVRLLRQANSGAFELVWVSRSFMN